MMSRLEERRYQLLRIQTQVRALFSKMRLYLRPFQPALVPVCDNNSLFISARGDVSPCVLLCPPIGQEMIWYQKNEKIRQKPLSFGNVQNMILAKIREDLQYRPFRFIFRKRKGYCDRKLTGISCSFSGNAQLDAAVERSHTSYRNIHRLIHARLKACGKLDGF